jgi:hypothetical protein
MAMTSAALVVATAAMLPMPLAMLMHPLKRCPLCYCCLQEQRGTGQQPLQSQRSNTPHAASQPTDRVLSWWLRFSATMGGL